MAGRPKRRARLLALKQAQDAAKKPIPRHTIPMVMNGGDEWEDTPAPPPPRPMERPDPKPEAPPSELEDALSAVLEVRSGIEKDQVYSKLVSLALEGAVEIMQIRLDPTHKSFGQLLTRKTSIISAVLSTTAKVNEADLRGKLHNKYDELLKAIKLEDAKLH